MGGFRRVLCATDLSEAADWAIESADREARLHGAELMVLHVVPLNYPGAPMTPESASLAMVEQETLASEVIDVLLERIERLTGRDAGQVAVMVEEGAPEETIIQQADDVAADLIVVGSIGETGDRSRLFGRVAEKVARHAHVSVLVARPGGETGRIILAADLMTPSEVAAQIAADEAMRRCASVIIVHSIEVLSPEVAIGEPSGMPALAFGAYPLEHLREAARRRLAETMTALGLAGEIEVTDGPPSDAIVKLAALKVADLVVIGTSGRTGIDRLLLGSVAKQVIRHAPCSVLVARPPTQARRKTGVTNLQDASPL